VVDFVVYFVCCMNCLIHSFVLIRFVLLFFYLICKHCLCMLINYHLSAQMSVSGLLLRSSLRRTCPYLPACGRPAFAHSLNAPAPQPLPPSSAASAHTPLALDDASTHSHSRGRSHGAGGVGGVHTQQPAFSFVGGGGQGFSGDRLLVSTFADADLDAVRMVWERNSEQVRQIFGFYAAAKEPRRQGSGPSKLLLAYEQCREALTDFHVLPHVVDAHGFNHVFRVCKLWELEVAEHLLGSAHQQHAPAAAPPQYFDYAQLLLREADPEVFAQGSASLLGLTGGGGAGAPTSSGTVTGTGGGSGSSSARQPQPHGLVRFFDNTGIFLLYFLSLIFFMCFFLLVVLVLVRWLARA
jgi:hypothetical protein